MAAARVKALPTSWQAPAPLVCRPPRAAPRRLVATRRALAGCVAFLDEPSAPAPDRAALPKLDIEETILLEGFGWQSCDSRRHWRTLREQVPSLASAGFTHVWLPPPSKSVSKEGYLPSQLYSLDSCYGSQQELRALCDDLRTAGIRPVADVVINHRCADAQDENGVWNIYKDLVPHAGRSIAWGRWAIAGSDRQFRGEGGADSGDDYGPAPDLDHCNQEVRDGLVDWLNWLRSELGFEGWRFDFAKGYHPRFTAEYIERTCGPEAFCVAELFLDLRWSNQYLEYDQDGARSRFRDWLKQARHSVVFDIITKGQLQEAVKHTQYDRLRDRDGKAPGLIGWWPARACTFVDNHDTGSTQQHWPFPRGAIDLGYAYILTHPGIPCIFLEHLADGGLRTAITTLVSIRKRAGLRADSKLEILAADRDMYVARCGGNVTVKLGPRFDMPQHLVPRKQDGWALAASGRDWAIWERA
ncbi:hypothetical protein ABPG75_012294 [Micractinium tetrahymenae]